MELMLLSLPTNCFIMKACKVNGFKHSGGKVFSFPIPLISILPCCTPFQPLIRLPIRGNGPQSSAVAIQAKKVSTLKTGGNPALYTAHYDDAFKWYPYLFLSRSKPETHLAAFSRIAEGGVAASAPVELRALIEYVTDKQSVRRVNDPRKQKTTGYLRVSVV